MTPRRGQGRLAVHLRLSLAGFAGVGGSRRSLSI